MTSAQKLLSAMHLPADQAVVVHNPSNMFYLTQGYTGEGVVYISQHEQAIITDFRYTEQAEQQSTGFVVHMTDKTITHEEWVAKLMKEGAINAAFYEDDYLTVAAFEKLQAAAGKEMIWQPLRQAPEKLREIKTEQEADAIRKACQIASDAYEKLLGEIHAGMTEKQIAIRLEFLMLELGAQGTSFSTIVATGAHGSLPHAIPGDAVVQPGDMITMDFGCRVDGYDSDMTRTIAVGQPSDEMRRVYETVYQAQKLGVEILAPGKNCFDVDKQVRDFIDNAGYAGRFGHGLGHAVGIDIHENPRLSVSCHEEVKVGHVLTIEPGIYLPGVGGVRIEDTCLVVPGGCEPLTKAPKELVIL